MSRMSEIRADAGEGLGIDPADAVWVLSLLTKAKGLLRRINRNGHERCGVTIHRDEDGSIYGCAFPIRHEGPHETMKERRLGVERIPSLYAEIAAFFAEMEK